MRLLPRSPSGTWLLAAAGWLAGCAAAWPLLPPAPRAEWRDLPGSFAVVDVLPAGPTVVMMRRRSCSLEPVTGPVILLDAATGRRRDLYQASDWLPDFQVSPDGKWAVARDGNRLQLRDTDTGAVLKPDHTDPFRLTRPLFSPSGEMLAYNDEVDGRHVIRIYDLRSRRTVGVLPDGESPLSFDACGHTLAYRAEAGPNGAVETRVAEWRDGTVRLRLPDRGSSRTELSPAGDRLVRFDRVGEECHVRCWDVATGALRWDISSEGAVALGGNFDRLLTCDGGPTTGSQAVSAWDTRDGRLLGRFALGPNDMIAATYHWASLTAPAVALWTDEPAHRLKQWLGSWAPWLGVRAATGRTVIVDVVTGQTIWSCPGWGRIAPDGRVVVDGQDGVQVWDVPPPKSLPCLLVAAGILAVPAAGLAGWRARRLRPRMK